jgi:hypothetical protein
MPKPKLSDEEKLQTQLLDALRQAIDGAPHRLQGSAKEPGLFPGGQTGAKLIHRARTEGLVQEVSSPEPPTSGKSRAKPAEYVTLTERGRQLVLEQDRPAKLLAGLREQLDTQDTAIAAGIQEARTQLSTFRESVDQLDRGLATRFSQYQQTVQTFRSILDRHCQHPVSVAPSVATKPGTPIPGWLDEVVPFIAAQKRIRSLDRPNLKRVYEHLRQTHPALTLGEFHDGMRTLHQQRRIRLDPYTQALATLQDPIHALYLDREVKYYVDLP